MLNDKEYRTKRTIQKALKIEKQLNKLNTTDDSQRLPLTGKQSLYNLQYIIGEVTLRASINQPVTVIQE